jgi:predicted NBD/HSP70 family sugar kinase
MGTSLPPVIVGLDNGGTMNNATVLDLATGRFLVEQMLEQPSRVREGPDVAIEALASSFQQVLDVTGVPRDAVRAVGLDTPGPASADGVLSSRGGTNLGSGWGGFNIRAALQHRLSVPVVYTNDANAAALYAHYARFGAAATRHSSVAAIVGTGLGGGLVEAGQVVSGAAGMAGELGHVQIPLEGLLAEGQPVPACNCGLSGDAESVASLTGIERNLLPFWLTRYVGHDLAAVGSLAKAAKLVRGYGEAGDEMALKIFDQQAMALGRCFSIAAMFTDPGTYFVGGGVVEADPAFSGWFLSQVRAHTTLRAEQAQVVDFALVPDLDRAGARGAALAARSATGDRA